MEREFRAGFYWLTIGLLVKRTVLWPQLFVFVSGQRNRTVILLTKVLALFTSPKGSATWAGFTSKRNGQPVTLSGTSKESCRAGTSKRCGCWNGFLTTAIIFCSSGPDGHRQPRNWFEDIASKRTRCPNQLLSVAWRKLRRQRKNRHAILSLNRI